MSEQRDRDPPIRVVLAEDHTLVRQGTRRLLEDSGRVVVVAEASDGHEAIAAVDQYEPDMVIVDIGLPGLNGIEATRRIKAGHPQVSVIGLTVHDEDQYVFALLEAGAAGYLLKDVEGQELLRAVEAVHVGESVLHPSITHKVLTRLAHGAPASAKPTDPLTDREHEVLALAAQGLANKEIAARLEVSIRTVETHLSRAFAKLEVGSRTEAVLHGLRRGWFDLEALEPPP